jgi:voltage-gated potassium channel Kch
MGVALGHVTEDALGLVTMVGLVTIAASTYMITFSHQLYRVFEPWLGPFERRGTPREPHEGAAEAAAGYPVILFGLGRFGTAIALRLKQRGIKVLGVDFNPQAVRRARSLGIDAEFGDGTDPEFVATLPLGRADWLASSVPVHATGVSHDDARLTLIQLARAAGFQGRVAVTSHNPAETEALTSAGADLVFEPFQDAADRAVELLGGARAEVRTEIPEIAAEERTPP